MVLERSSSDSIFFSTRDSALSTPRQNGIMRSKMLWRSAAALRNSFSAFSLDFLNTLLISESTRT